MNKLFVYVIIVHCWCSCNQEANTLSSTTIKMGAPKAIVTTTVDSRTQIIGPLSYAPQLPKLIDGDTIEVKMDVRHKLYQVANSIFFTAWVYGDSLPGPVLRIKLGQTVKFY